MKTSNNFFQKVFASPILWGGLLSLGFYAALHNGLITHPMMHRYFAGHEVEYITTIMFFVGLSALTMKFFQVAGQRKALKSGTVLGERSPVKAEARHVGHFLEKLDEHERKHGASLLTRRLRAALRFVGLGASSEELDTELRYLSDEDATKADSDYGLVRLILWAVPMLGFLGTVIGITMALGDLDLNAINESSKKLSAGLSIAFDTTALAIALDLVLYFIQFLVYRAESNLLWEVDHQAGEELRGRFETSMTPEDNSQVVAVRRMFDTVAESLEQLFVRQGKIWEQTLSAAQQRFSKITGESTETIQKALAAALNENLSAHARSLAQAESQLLEKSGVVTLKFTEALRESATGIASLQAETVRQTEAVRGIVGSCGQLAQLEERLHQNLAALAQVGNFEETVNSLAAAIHLLNGRNHFAELRRQSPSDENNKEKGSAA